MIDNQVQNLDEIKKKEQALLDRQIKELELKQEEVAKANDDRRKREIEEIAAFRIEQMRRKVSRTLTQLPDTMCSGFRSAPSQLLPTNTNLKLGLLLSSSIVWRSQVAQLESVAQYFYR